MEHQQKQAGLVLHYDKRRFDGGTEIEQIRSIEKQQQLQAEGQPQTTLPLHQRQPYGTAPVMDRPSGTPAPAACPLPVELPTASPETDNDGNVCAKVSHARKFQDVLLTGPLSICVGLVGVFTAFLALLVANRMNNPELEAQGKMVLSECRKAVGKGMVDTLSIPLRVLQLKNAK